jgi:hypothetical protein
MSGVVEHAYETVVHPLQVLSQIEFSKIMRPQQISRSPWNIGIGITYLLLSVAGISSKKIPHRMKWLLFLMCGRQCSTCYQEYPQSLVVQRACEITDELVRKYNALRCIQHNKAILLHQSLIYFHNLFCDLLPGTILCIMCNI